MVKRKYTKRKGSTATGDQRFTVGEGYKGRLEMFAVDKGVPIPASASRASGARRKYPFDTMEVGDSFFIPVNLGEGFNPRASEGDYKRFVDVTRRIAICVLSSARRKLPMKITTYTDVDNLGVRVWRIA